MEYEEEDDHMEGKSLQELFMNSFLRVQGPAMERLKLMKKIKYVILLKNALQTDVERGGGLPDHSVMKGYAGQLELDS